MSDSDTSRPLLGNHSTADETSGDELEVALRQTSRTQRSKSKRICYWVLAFLVLSLLVAAGVVLALLLVEVGAQPPRVYTTCGEIEGHYSVLKRVFSFKGIPYAGAPVGKQRWRPPETCEKTPHLRKALNYGAQCAQPVYASNMFRGSEDCLLLNVYTPSTDDYSNLPVMVHIYGHSLLAGNASVPGYSPDETLTYNTHMVHVNVQYRMGVFGFLVLKELENRTGNYGLLDQIEALKWVQRNIKNFGGDPDQVTVWGHGSGGTSVLALLISPLAHGLFNKAILMSPSPDITASYDEALPQHENVFLENTRCRSTPSCNTSQCIVDCLYNLSTANLIQATPKNLFGDFLFDLPKKNQFPVPLLVIDGTVIPDSPTEVWKKKLPGLSDVPVLIGSTAQETDLGYGSLKNVSKWTNMTYQDTVALHLDPFGENITAEALVLYPYKNQAELQYTSMGSEVRAICATSDLARTADSQLKSGVYRYVVTYKPPSPVHIPYTDFNARYAYHGIDNAAFTQGRDSSFDRAFTDNIWFTIISFAKTGKPDNKKWRTAGNSTNSVALLSSSTTFKTDYVKDRCDFWSKKDFGHYSWRN